MTIASSEVRGSYAELLHLDTLLATATPYFDKPHHDELQFLIVHQCSELWFKLVLHELDAICGQLAADRLREATALLYRVRRIVSVLAEGLLVMSTMTARDFAAFRERLFGRSGFQSAQFREIEIVLGRQRSASFDQPSFSEAERHRIAARLRSPDLWTEYVRALRRVGYDVNERVAVADPAQAERSRRALRTMYLGGAHPEHRAFSEELVELDAALLLWRSQHAVMAENMIGAKPGTGTQHVDYLYRQARERCFPELIELRACL